MRLLLYIPNWSRVGCASLLCRVLGDNVFGVLLMLPLDADPSASFKTGISLYPSVEPKGDKHDFIHDVIHYLSAPTNITHIIIILETRKL